MDDDIPEIRSVEDFLTALRQLPPQEQHPDEKTKALINDRVMLSANLEAVPKEHPNDPDELVFCIAIAGTPGESGLVLNELSLAIGESPLHEACFREAPDEESPGVTNYFWPAFSILWLN